MLPPERSRPARSGAVAWRVAAVELAGSAVLGRFAEVRRAADNPRAKAKRQLAALRKEGA